uniref:Uncharacterized protein n=1 Tax=Plectus sambesii TaxID=2011161 RepID=A0A914WHZ3_9BILA
MCAAMKRTVADWKLKHAESVKQFVRSGGSDMLAVADFVNSASHKTSVDRRDDRRDSLLGSGDRYVLCLSFRRYCARPGKRQARADYSVFG